MQAATHARTQSASHAGGHDLRPQHCSEQVARWAWESHALACDWADDGANNAAQISVFPVQVSDSGNSVESVVVGNTHSNLDRNTSDSLREFARSTGGEETLYTDTVENLVRRAEDRTTNYYLLKFTPESAKSDIKWQPLRVEVNVDSVDLKAPKGILLFPNTK